MRAPAISCIVLLALTAPPVHATAPKAAPKAAPKPAPPKPPPPKSAPPKRPAYVPRFSGNIDVYNRAEFDHDGRTTTTLNLNWTWKAGPIRFGIRDTELISDSVRSNGAVFASAWNRFGPYRVNYDIDISGRGRRVWTDPLDLSRVGVRQSYRVQVQRQSATWSGSMSARYLYNPGNNSYRSVALSANLTKKLTDSVNLTVTDQEIWENHGPGQNILTYGVTHRLPFRLSAGLRVQEVNTHRHRDRKYLLVSLSRYF